MRVPHRSIEDFLARRTGWLTRQIEAQARRTREPLPGYVTGEVVPFLGHSLPLVIREFASDRSASVRLVNGSLEVAIAPMPAVDERRSAVVAALERWYRAQAEADLQTRVALYQPLVKAAPASVLIRAQKHLWGSCSPGGVLRFNWRLVMAPPGVVDYVVVHELCHLRHPHHQTPFWDAVGTILPDYRARRAQLRREGDSYRL